MNHTALYMKSFEESPVHVFKPAQNENRLPSLRCHSALQFIATPDPTRWRAATHFPAPGTPTRTATDALRPRKWL